MPQLIDIIIPVFVEALNIHMRCGISKNYRSIFPNI